MDRYSSFVELTAKEPAEAFSIEVRQGRLDTLVMAPHGGWIEPGTSELAHEIAGADLSLYSFSGRKPNSNRDLHITSTNFDEPQAEEMLKSARTVITVHGLGDKRNEYVLVGGLHIELKDFIVFNLQKNGFYALPADGTAFEATNPQNICNRGYQKRGVQLEISRPLRDRLNDDPILKAEFVFGIRRSLSEIEPEFSARV